jgi:hypothetical protein
MPALVVNGVTIPIAPGGASQEAELIGDRDRMFDGSMREVSDGYKARAPFVTPPLSPADYTTIRAALLATPPVTCSGDLAPAVSCFVELGAADAGKVAGAIRRVLRFTLLEA